MAKQDTTVSAADLGFGDTFDLGSYYLDEDEKDAAIMDRTPFFITNIDYDTKNKFGERYILGLVLASDPTGDNRGWAMAATNAKRNEILDGIMVRMSRDNIKRIGPVFFLRRGRTVMFQPFEAADKLPESDPAPEREDDTPVQTTSDTDVDLPF